MVLNEKTIGRRLPPESIPGLTTSLIPTVMEIYLVLILFSLSSSTTVTTTPSLRDSNRGNSYSSPRSSGTFTFRTKPAFLSESSENTTVPWEKSHEKSESLQIIYAYGKRIYNTLRRWSIGVYGLFYGETTALACKDSFKFIHKN